MVIYEEWIDINELLDMLEEQMKNDDDHTSSWMDALDERSEDASEAAVFAALRSY
jgi:hypothetical protein